MSARYLVLFVPLLVFMGACSKNPPPLTQQEKQTVTELTENLKPRCVGRYMIDMPAGAMSAGSATIQGVTFEATRMTREMFEKGVAAREAELKATKSREGYRFMYDHGEVNGVPGSRYFVTLGNPDADSDLGRVIEAYKWDAGYQIKLQTGATDSIHSEFEKQVKGTPYEAKDWKVNDVPEKTSLVLGLIQKVRGRADDEIPTEPGVCFLGGFLPRKAADGEGVRMLFAMKNKTDVSFDLKTNTDLRELPKDTLLNRMPEIRSQIKDPNTNGHIIRTGTVTVGGITAEEALMSARTVARIPGHVFTLQANTATSGATTPYLVLDMDNGSFNGFTGNVIKKASLTEGEAIALWDTVSRTLRPRPNGF